MYVGFIVLFLLIVVTLICDLLNVDRQRETSLVRGSRQFDPRNVGFESVEVSQSLIYDVKKDGNHNSGHNYGRSLV